jgi:hypothetical protein
MSQAISANNPDPLAFAHHSGPWRVPLERFSFKSRRNDRSPRVWPSGNFAVVHPPTRAAASRTTGREWLVGARKPAREEMVIVRRHQKTKDHHTHVMVSTLENILRTAGSQPTGRGRTSKKVHWAKQKHSPTQRYPANPISDQQQPDTGAVYFLRCRIRERIRRFLRPTLRRPRPVFLTPTSKPPESSSSTAITAVRNRERSNHLRETASITFPACSDQEPSKLYGWAGSAGCRRAKTRGKSSAR